MSNRFQANRDGGTQLVVLVGVLLLAIVLAIWIWTRPRIQPSPEAGQIVAEQFLGYIRDGQPQSAWEAATADFKSDQGQEKFVGSVKSVKLLKEPVTFVSVQTVELQEQPRTEYLFRGTDGDVRVLIGREAGRWKVDRLTY